MWDIGKSFVREFLIQIVWTAGVWEHAEITGRMLCMYMHQSMERINWFIFDIIQTAFLKKLNLNFLNTKSILYWGKAS